MGMYELIKLLAESETEYVLVGGLAVALHGYPRVTMDVDVVLAMEPANLERFIAHARAAGLRPVMPVPLESLAQPERLEQWRREKGMLAFALQGREAQATVLDVLIASPVPYADLRREAILLDIGPYRVPVASIDHLIAMKAASQRSKDRIDLEALKKLRDGESS
ncbi:MAG: nucleotidyl transferase AbiEii/AbiGii toxin family protein [Rhodocyclaceae bacterium]|nr:nucleotidyl transferase AbiEii/AbiGii toxin family protein [Rhodocyclaceae bacterium]